MSKEVYSFIGWLGVQIAKRVAQRKVHQNRGKLAASGVVALVIVAGIAAAAAEDD
jgi:hypothetical protein